MDYLINHIRDPADFDNLPNQYKTISGLKQRELAYYILRLNKENDLNAILDFIGSKYYMGKYNLKQIANDSERMVLVLEINLDEEKFCKAAFKWHKNSAFVYVMTDYGKKRKILEKFLDNCYPLMERTSLKSYQIVDSIIKNLLSEGYLLDSSMVYEKKWWKKERIIKPSLDYPTTIPIEDVIVDLEKRDAFIHSIDLNIYNQDKVRLCKFFVSRKGLLKFIDGDFGLFKKFVLTKSLDLFSEDHNNLTNREQRGEVIKPIIIEFPIKEKDPKTIIKQFTNTLRENRNFSLLTHHNGNPLFYADVSDIREGSFFGVMFEAKESQAKMTILPHEISTSISLSKFLDYIFLKFGEGKIIYPNDL